SPLVALSISLCRLCSFSFISPPPLTSLLFPYTTLFRSPAAFDLVALLRSIDYAAGLARLQRTDALDSEVGTLVVNGFGSDPSALRAIIDSPEYLWASQVQHSLLSGYSRARGESVGLHDPA